MTALFDFIKIQMEHKIPIQMLKHLQYLRNLHLQSPRIGNAYLQDTALQAYTQQFLDANTGFKNQLIRLGDRFVTIYQQASRDAQRHQPTLQQFDSYGRRIDKLHLSEGWKKLSKYSSEDGIVALAYQQDKYKLGQYQRYGQLVALYMYQSASGLYGCPLAMTDGAAYTLQKILKNVNTRKSYLHDAFEHLISRTDPWTSGQWMTQKKGGSDVSNTETIAIKEDNSQIYRLYGYKWFTSATDSQMSLGLAKILPKGVQPTQQALKGTKVSLFFIKMRNQKEQLNHMQIIRLKDKLGTRQLPTAQLLLKGAQAYLISDEGQGVKFITKMLTVTRIYNSASAVSIIAKITALARDYAERRVIGKTKLSKLPLQLRVLSDMQVTHRASLIFYLKMSQLFSKEHAGTINFDQANILRIMTPLLKLFTGKEAVRTASEGLQAFGGMGYIQSSMLPTLLRDAQVLTIWQGTTNVLCYDFVRALMKKQNKIWPIESLIKFCTKIFDSVHNRQFKLESFVKTSEIIALSYNKLIANLTKYLKTNFQSFSIESYSEKINVSPFAELRNLCFGTARIFIALLLQYHLLSSFRQIDLQITTRWVQRGLYIPEDFDTKKDEKLAMNFDVKGDAQGTGDIDKRGVIRAKF